MRARTAAEIHLVRLHRASFQELIFTNKDGGGDGFCKEAFKGIGYVQDENIQ
jgi:hypothetical protein